MDRDAVVRETRLASAYPEGVPGVETERRLAIYN